MLFAALAGASGPPPLRVVATIEPLAMIVRELTGERATVSVLVPPGASPHTFDPRPGDVARLADAALLVAVGGDFDGWAGRLLGASASGAAPLRVVATIEPLAMLVRELAGERAAVSVLVPPGASPHTFDPRPGDVARIADAAL
ncbi:MAG TPA: metal ABC transporter substrate-binding protein, partial [Myxococcota bacterium]|nr:metal ABC transporter substrate-binding protein [Myxococcota bacterium]